MSTHQRKQPNVRGKVNSEPNTNIEPGLEDSTSWRLTTRMITGRSPVGEQATKSERKQTEDVERSHFKIIQVDRG